jgi:hypothetical protein
MDKALHFGPKLLITISYEKFIRAKMGLESVHVNFLRSVVFMKDNSKVKQNHHSVLTAS